MRYCVLPEVSCGIYWHCLFTALPLRPWVRSDLLFCLVSCLHYGQEPDRNLPHSCHHQESWYFSRICIRFPQSLSVGARQKFWFRDCFDHLFARIFVRNQTTIEDGEHYFKVLAADTNVVCASDDLWLLYKRI